MKTMIQPRLAAFFEALTPGTAVTPSPASKTPSAPRRDPVAFAAAIEVLG